MEFYGSIHNHTDRSNFRLRDSTNRLDELCWYAAKELKHDFIAITDHETIATAIDCQKVEKEIRKEFSNFKVIRGNEIYLCRNGLSKDNYIRGEDKFYHFILLAKDAEGHRQIRELSTRAWSHAFTSGRMVRVPTYYSDLQEVIGINPGHVIFSQACIGSKVAQLVLDYEKDPTEEKYEYIKQWILHISEICGKENYFLEVQPSFNKEQIIVNKRYKILSEELNIPVVISLDAHYLKKEDEPIHHAFLTAQDGERETSEFYASTYMMSREEIHSYMDNSLGKETVSLWMNNTQKIYNMCEDYDLTKPTRIVYLPLTIDEISLEEFNLFKNQIKELEYFYTSTYKENKDLAAAIVRAILNRPKDFNNAETFEAIDDNLKAIRLASEKMNTQWSAYLLNLRDYVKVIWEKGNSLMGCARGSGTGFFLLYLLNVTQINPLWETTKTYSFRFLNPERVSPLDVDLDIEGGKRPQVYKALQDTYGKDRVSKVLTIRTEKSKSAILTACFKKGTLINTLSGEKPIEEVSSNDYVETLNGFQKVCSPTYCFGRPSVKIKTKNSENPYFICTPDHKILTIKKKNNHRIDGDILTPLAKKIFPELKKYKATDSIYQTYICNFRKVQPQWVEAKDIIKNVHYGLVPIDSFVDNKKYITWENDFHKKYGIGISQNIKIDEDFCELIGIWIAEGSILHNTGGIAFTINKNEELFKKRIIQLMWKVFQMDNFGIYERQDSLALTIQYSSRQIGDFFSQLFTGYKDVRTRPDFHRKLTQWGKRIPEQLKNINPFLQLQIFKGWFIGDGYASLRNGTSPQSKGTTVSKELAYDFIQILHRNYLNPSVDFEERTDQRESTYNLTFYANKAKRLYEMKYHSDLSAPLIFTLEDRGDKDIPVQYNDKLYMRAKLELVENDLNTGEEEVYCLSMPEENFCINHLVVHNCRGLGLDPDEGQYLASFIKSDRGQQRTLEQTYYGDEENDMPPDLKFRELMDGKYQKVWKVAKFIGGLCCGMGSHAGGVIFYDEPITNLTALMQTTNGDVITQYDLHTIEEVSCLKIDLLSIEGLDRMRACIDLLTEYNYLDRNKTLRERYEDAVGIYRIDRNNKKMWELIHNHKIESLFQMEQQSGIKGIAAVKPTSIDDLAALNAVIRLMAPEKGAEQPIEKFARFKKNPQEWYDEMNSYGVSKNGQKVLEKILKISYGLCIQQEQFMMLVQQPEIGGFSLLWADRLRKAISKKKPKEYDELTQEFFKQTKEKGCEEALCKYVWHVLIAMNRGYGFNAAHTLAYSLVALQEMNLAYKYPIIFWDTANLIVDSGAMNLEEQIYSEDDEDDEEKLKNSSTDYGKVASAIGKMKSRGLYISLPDINKSKLTFSPDIENNQILYGLRGITRVGNQLIKEIIEKRPYNSIDDFLNKIKVNKTQMISLIKSGAFDELYNNRKEAMNYYLNLIADKKKRITLQNMQMLIAKDLIPIDFSEECKIFNFNKYLKKFKKDDYYLLDDIALEFYQKKYDENLLEDIVINDNSRTAKIKQIKWDNIYKKAMDPIRLWMKENQERILQELNFSLLKEVEDKYANGSISKWEMDSLSFYNHEHELSKLRNDIYSIDDFNNLKNDEIENQFKTKNGDNITLFKIHRIAGTVIDKNKNKNMITLLTTTGVVTIKIWKSQFSSWDKQISQRDIDGAKHVLEKSWFTRGNKLIITGVRRDDTFIPKKYKNTEWPLFEKIEEIDDKGFIISSTTERLEVDD